MIKNATGISSIEAFLDEADTNKTNIAGYVDDINENIQNLKKSNNDMKETKNHLNERIESVKKVFLAYGTYTYEGKEQEGCSNTDNEIDLNCQGPFIALFV